MKKFYHSLFANNNPIIILAIVAIVPLCAVIKTQNRIHEQDLLRIDSLGSIHISPPHIDTLSWLSGGGEIKR